MLQPPGSARARITRSKNASTESPDDAIRRMQKMPLNKRCADCNSKFPQCVNLTHAVFICMACSGIHREFSHKIKGIGHSSFSVAEANQLKEGGNEVVNLEYLARFNAGRERINAPQDNQDQQLLRVWIRRKYVEKAWYSPNSNSAQPAVAGQAVPQPTAAMRKSEPAPVAANIDLFGGWDNTPAAPAPAPAAPPQHTPFEANFGPPTPAQPAFQANFGAEPVQQPPSQPQFANFASFGEQQSSAPSNTPQSSMHSNQAAYQQQGGQFPQMAPQQNSFVSPAPQVTNQSQEGFANFEQQPQPSASMSQSSANRNTQAPGFGNQMPAQQNLFGSPGPQPNQGQPEQGFANFNQQQQQAQQQAQSGSAQNGQQAPASGNQLPPPQSFFSPPAPQLNQGQQQGGFANFRHDQQKPEMANQASASQTNPQVASSANQPPSQSMFSSPLPQSSNQVQQQGGFTNFNQQQQTGIIDNMVASQNDPHTSETSTQMPNQQSSFPPPALQPSNQAQQWGTFANFNQEPQQQTGLANMGPPPSMPPPSAPPGSPPSVPLAPPSNQQAHSNGMPPNQSSNGQQQAGSVNLTTDKDHQVPISQSQNLTQQQDMQYPAHPTSHMQESPQVNGQGFQTAPIKEKDHPLQQQLPPQGGQIHMQGTPHQHMSHPLQPSMPPQHDQMSAPSKPEIDLHGQRQSSPAAQFESGFSKQAAQPQEQQHHHQNLMSQQTAPQMSTMMGDPTVHSSDTPPQLQHTALPPLPTLPQPANQQTIKQVVPSQPEISIGQGFSDNHSVSSIGESMASRSIAMAPSKERKNAFDAFANLTLEPIPPTVSVASTEGSASGDRGGESKLTAMPPKSYIGQSDMYPDSNNNISTATDNHPSHPGAEKTEPVDSKSQIDTPSTVNKIMEALQGLNFEQVNEVHRYILQLKAQEKENHQSVRRESVSLSGSQQSFQPEMPQQAQPQMQQQVQQAQPELQQQMQHEAMQQMHQEAQRQMQHQSQLQMQQQLQLQMPQPSLQPPKQQQVPPQPQMQPQSPADPSLQLPKQQQVPPQPQMQPQSPAQQPAQLHMQPHLQMQHQMQLPPQPQEKVQLPPSFGQNQMPQQQALSFGQNQMPQQQVPSFGQNQMPQQQGMMYSQNPLGQQFTQQFNPQNHSQQSMQPQQQPQMMSYANQMYGQAQFPNQQMMYGQPVQQNFNQNGSHASGSSNSAPANPF